MKVDVYKRPDTNGKYSYLAVPQGRPIPEEATAVDWETEQHNIDLDPDNQSVDGLSADDALAQINTKGYAISRSQQSASGSRF